MKKDSNDQTVLATMNLRRWCWRRCMSYRSISYGKRSL